MLLSKITQLVYYSLPHVPSVLQSIMLEYFGSFYEVELIEHMEEINETMSINWTRLVPVVATMEDAPEQEETKQTSSSSTSLYTHLQESIKVSIAGFHWGLGIRGKGATGPAGATNPADPIDEHDDGRRPILVSVEDAKLFFIYHPQLKDALIYHEPLDSFLIPYKYSRFYLLPEFFVKLNMFVALPNINKVNGRGLSFRIAVSLA